MTKAGQKTYLYQFARIAPGGDNIGAIHASEVSYVFGNRLAWLPRDETDEALSQAMAGYWTRFAATGDPNGGQAPTWPVHGGDREAYLELGNTIAAKVDLKRDVCDALEPAMRSGWARPAPSHRSYGRSFRLKKSAAAPPTVSQLECRMK